MSKTFTYCTINIWNCTAWRHITMERKINDFQDFLVQYIALTIKPDFDLKSINYTALLEKFRKKKTNFLDMRSNDFNAY